jgi:two-component system NarL family sensor kinase
MLLRQKVLLLAVAPLVVSAVLLAMILRSQSRALTEREVAEVEQTLLVAKQAELKNYVDLARQAIRDLERSDRDDEETRRRALEVL